MSPEQAIEIVARDVLHRCAADIAGGVGSYEWGDYPELAELDWERVEQVLLTLAPRPETTDFAAAYDLLEARAVGGVAS